MNPGLFGFIAGTSGGSSKLRIRKPFSVAEQNKSGIRVSDLGSHAFGRTTNITNIIYTAVAASPAIAVAVGYTNAAVPAATTTAMSSVDGITWSVRTIGSGIYTNVVWTGTRFIAHIGAGTSRSDSTDGLTWSAGTALPSAGGFLVVHNGKLYQFPTAGTVYYEFTTTDAAASTTRTSPANYAAPTNMISACGALIETVSASQLRYSYNGVAWNTAASPGFIPNNITGNSSILVAYDADGQYNISKTAGATWEFAIPKMLNASAFGLLSEAATTSFGVTANGATPAFTLTTNFSISQLGPNPLPLGERFCVKFNMIQRTDANGAISSNNYQFIAHSTDGYSWTIEFPRFGTNTTTYNTIKGTPFNDRWIFCEYASAAGTNSYISVTNPDFEELIYDV